MNAKKIIYIVLGLMAVVILSRWVGGPREETVPVVELEEGSDPVLVTEDDPAETGPGEELGEELGDDPVTVPDEPQEPGETDPQEQMVPIPIPQMPETAAQASTLRDWLVQGAPEGTKDRELWLGRGIALARERQPRMRQWIEEDPEQALAEALTPRMFAALPEEVRALVERPVAEEGFFGVLAICNHGPNEEHIGSCEIRHEVLLGFGTFEAEAFQASIYGARKEKMTVEEDSIYGVAMDGRIALHEDEIVIVDDGEGATGGRFAVYYRGQVRYADTLEEAEGIRESLR